MPHSVDPEQDDDKFTQAHVDREGEAASSVGVMANCVRSNHNNLGSAEYQGSSSSSGGGGSSSSSSGGGGSDDDDGGECSLDSYQSDKNSIHSPNTNRCHPSLQRVSPGLTNGIEVKPCRSVVDDELRDRLTNANELSESTNAASAEKKDDGLGGFLRFFLDGRCVLELRHDCSNEGQSKQWVQSYGKTYRSSIATVPTSCTPAWQPQESSNHDVSEDIRVNSPSVTLSPNKKKPYNNFYLTFFARSRREPNLNVLPFCVLRKAARRPGEVVSKELCCPHEKMCCKRHTLRQRTTTLVQKSQRLNLLVDGLAHEYSGESLPGSKNSRKSGSLGGLLLGALIQKKSSDSSKNSHVQALTKRISSPAVVGQEDQDEVEKGGANKPLPEWYFDPSKATIPVDEMIGNPRPSLLSSQSTLVSNKRPSDDSYPSHSEAKKQAKEDTDTVDVDSKSQPFSSHCCVPHSKSPSLEKTNVAASPFKVESEVSEETTPASTVNSTGKISETVQRKKKKGGGYGRGRTIGEAVRTFVISEILNLGGDVRTNYVPRGVFTEVASRYKIDATTTYRWWLKYCNGIRMAASGNINQPDTSHKGFLSNRVTAVPVMVPDHKTRADHFYKEVKSLHNPHILESSTLKRDHMALMASGASLAHGGRYSPRSDDSASSGASLVDPTALYVSSLTLAPPTGVWPAGVPLGNLPNSQLPFQTMRLPLPLGVCVPYLWNCSTEQPNVNGISGEKQNRLESKGSPIINSDEPLDLTVPKKEKSDGSSLAHCSKIENLKVLNTGLGTYSECQSDQFILRTLLSTHGQPTTAGSNNLVDKEASYSIGKPFAKSLAQRNMKPKHYPFLSLQIGSFEIHSNLDTSQSCDRDHFKEIPNKFKVIFTQRKFVYEFETNAEMHLPSDDGNQKESPPSVKRMACIVVPFNIVEAFWCYGATIVLRVVSQPFMFLGRKLKQVGCVPSLTVYETKKSVDLTGGQLSMAHLHKVTLIKPHLIEQLKIYLVLFDVRFRNLISPVAHSLVSTEDRAAEHTETND